MVGDVGRWFDDGAGHGRGWPVAQGRVRPNLVVMAAPRADHDPSLFQAVEDLPLQALVPEFPVEALAVAILPRAARGDVQGLGSKLRQPLSKGFGDHRGAVVTTNMLRHALLKHGIRQGLDHAQAVDAPLDPEGQALARVFVDERQNAQAAPVMGVALDKVEAPDMVGPLRPQPDAGAGVEPQPTAGPMLLGNLEPLATPDALNPVLAHTPACDLQQSRDPAVAIAPVFGRQ